ncbi:MAG: thiamine pyrophosphate-binding protein [Deltaproteobacteria bacterium]|nr:thiamine pyrophosphate-binding protein [Deltaproteobacteria bacterium]MBW2361279.1 thiamine pyrophosphate-binding protein [Deltaproteobacteria bacterium]
MAEIDGGRIAARQLKAAGIDTVFGVVAGPTIEVMAGAQAEGLQVIGCRHEMNAAFMASAWGWARRKPGVMVAGSGPGMTNCVTPLYVATESAMPLVVLGGSTYANTLGVGGFQEADQVAFANPACKWTGRVDATERIGEWLHLALARAQHGRPGGVYLDFPGHFVANRVAEETAPLRSRAPEVAHAQPDPNAIDRVADMLAKAERPLVVVGKGAAWADAGPALERLVGRGIPYVTSPMARGTLPDDRAEFVNAARSAALKGADAILMVGARFNWIFGFGRPPRYRPDARIAQIDVAAEEFTSAADVEIGIVADAAAAVAALCEALDGRTLASGAGGWLEELATQRERNEAALAPLLENDSVPIHPYRLVREVRDALPRDANFVTDGETIMGICRAVMPIYRSRSCFNASTTGCIGTGVPYAVGAALADPSRPCVAVVGDYAFGAAAMAVETAARVGAKPVIVVANNEGIAGHLLQDHMLPPGSPPIAALLPANYEKMAEMVDGAAFRVERPEEIRPALDAALAADRVALVHVRIDPKAARAGGANYLQ